MGLLSSLWINHLNTFTLKAFPRHLVAYNGQNLLTQSLSLILDTNMVCFQSTMAYSLLRRWVAVNLRSLSLPSSIWGFRWYRFVLFSGLGYKRRVYKKYNTIFTYVGDRHWILYKFKARSFVGAHRRRNFVFFSSNKGGLLKDYNFFSSLRDPFVYKMKGFIDARVRGRFLFVRRIKIRGIRTKLSKKQQLL